MCGEMPSKLCLLYNAEEKKSELPYAAGHYVPQLAELVYERNKKGKPYIDLKGFIVRILFKFYDALGFIFNQVVS